MAVATILGVLFNPLRALNKIPVDLGNLVIAGSKITMEQPRLAGFTRDQRPYEVSARAASQDITKPQIMELQDLNAKIELQDRSTVKMTAKAGIYDTKAEKLRISPNIVLTATNGYEGYLEEAEIDIRTGHVVSRQPVTLKMISGTLNAKSMEIVNAGEVIRFEGGVVLDLDPQKVPSATAEKSAP